jgi:hypothetical protein
LSTLEYRYRSLLAWYPVEHRALHEEEMLSVLLAGARPDQTRPTPAETFDLIRGALRIRSRHLTGGPATPWRDALAITGLIATVLLVAEGLRFALNVPADLRWISLRHASPMHPSPSLLRQLVIYYGTAPYWIAWAVIAVLALRGVRRSATIGACAVTGVQLAASWYGTTLPTFRWSSLAASLAGIPLLLALLATAALLLSPGPRYGAALLGRRQVGGVFVLAAVLVVAFSYALSSLVIKEPPPRLATQAWASFISSLTVWHRFQFAAVAVSAVLAVAWLARSAAGRRACALLAVPATPLIYWFAGVALGGPNSGLPSLSHLAAAGLVGFILVMLGVRLAELPSRQRARGRQGDTA